MVIKNKKENTVEIFPSYDILYISVFDVLGSCFLEQQLARHFNETTCAIYLLFKLPNKQCASSGCMDYWRFSSTKFLS